MLFSCFFHDKSLFLLLKSQMSLVIFRCHPVTRLAAAREERLGGGAAQGASGLSDMGLGFFQISNFHLVSLDWFKGKFTGKHVFYHQI